MLRQVAPVRADVAERRRGAALVGLEPPRVVGVLEQPVLQVVADEEVRLADVPARDRVPRLLHERVAAIVERHGVDDPRLGRLIDQLLGFSRGHRQWLVGHDVLALGNRRRVHRIVQVIWRGVVYHVDVGVVQEGVVAAVGLGHAERVRFCPCRGVAAAGNRHDVDEPQPPDRIDVVRADKARADNPHPDPFHQHPPEAAIRTVIIYQGLARISGLERAFPGVSQGDPEPLLTASASLSKRPGPGLYSNAGGGRCHDRSWRVR